jgi:hypothetical protein
MNIGINRLIIVGIIFVIIMYMYNYTEYYGNNESFTNDEAIQNIASLYNQAQLTVTNFTSTGKGTFNDLNATTIKATGQISTPGAIGTGSANITGGLTAGSANVTGNLTAGNVTAGNASIKSMGPERVFVGQWAGTNVKGPNSKYNETVGTTQANAYKPSQNSMCPNGSYMVGMQKGSQWDWYYPLCRSFS